MNASPENSFRVALPWVAWTSFIFLVSYQSRAIFGPLLPYLEADFGLTHAQATRYPLYIALGYSLSLLSTMYTMTRVTSRRLAATSTMAAGGVLLLMACAPGPVSLGWLCVLLGLTTGQYLNAGLAVLRSLVPLGQWSKAIAVHELGPNLSFFFLPNPGCGRGAAFRLARGACGPRCGGVRVGRVLSGGREGR